MKQEKVHRQAGAVGVTLAGLLHRAGQKIERIVGWLEKELGRCGLHDAVELRQELTVARVAGEQGTYWLTRVPTVMLPVLTVREREVAALLSAGFSGKEVAGRLHVSPRTVDSHREQVYAKLNVHSRVELVRRLALQDREVGARG